MLKSLLNAFASSKASTQTLTINEVSKSPSILFNVKKYFKNLSFYLFTGVTAIPSAVYALMFPSGENPSALGEEWWHSMSLGNQFFSLLTGGAAFGANAFANIQYFPETIAKVNQDLHHYCDSASHFFKSNITILLALSAAFSAATLSHDAFTAPGEWVALFMALFQFCVYAARRYAGSAAFIERTQKLLNADARLQNRIITDLQQLLPEYEELVQEFLKTHELSDAAIYPFLIYLYQLALDLKKQNKTLFKSPSRWQTLLHYSGVGIDLGVGILFAYFYYALNGQKGLDGINTLSELFTGEDLLNDSSLLLQHAVAFMPGLASALQAAVNGLDMRETLIEVLQSLKTQPRKGALAMTVLGSSALAATAMSSAAKSVAEQPNIFALTKHSSYTKLFIITTGMTNCSVLANPTIKKLHLTTENALITWLQKNTLSKTSLTALRHHGYFKPLAGDTNPALTKSDHLTENSLVLSSNCIRYGGV